MLCKTMMSGSLMSLSHHPSSLLHNSSSHPPPPRLSLPLLCMKKLWTQPAIAASNHNTELVKLKESCMANFNDDGDDQAVLFDDHDLNISRGDPMTLIITPYCLMILCL